MCDTIIALNNATKNGRTLFGKNSDREPDEVQNIVIEDRKYFPEAAEIKCTFKSIKQTSETNRILLLKPFWMYGAEMGANEYGVVIGNEALFTKLQPAAQGLTGMDLLRLALERSKTALEARNIIIELLQEHNQGGETCGYRHKMTYMNGFIIADAQKAFVLETVDKMWAWKEIHDVWSISNRISLESDYDECDPRLIDYAIKKKWCKSRADFNFSRCYSAKIMTWGAAGKQRQLCTRQQLLNKKGLLTTKDFMNILRSHGNEENGKIWHPDHGFKGTVCKHPANNLTRPDSSVGSMVASIGEIDQNFYSTGCANPCMSPYFPIFAPNTYLPNNYINGSEKYEPNSFWWKAEKIHRKAIMNYHQAMEGIQQKLEDFENKMISQVEQENSILNQASIDEYFNQVNQMMEEWEKKLKKLSPITIKRSFRKYWNKYNQLNNIEEKKE